ncbi:MAG: ABC transporter substrate-binding protein [Spirochaetota bacterium]
MKRFTLIVIGLLLVAAFAFASGAQESGPTEMDTATVNSEGESPLLASRVQAGELPPLEERLPANPRDIQPAKEVGAYGGELRYGFQGTSPAWGGLLYVAGWENLLSWTSDFNGVVPNLVERYEASADAREHTFFMREGMKWSDGEPFTADDIMFYINDVLFNEELYPSGFAADWVPGNMRDGFEAEKVDDYTFKLIFPEPYGSLPYKLAMWEGRQFSMYPKHYLEQFHVDYNPNIDELIAEEEGVEDWVGLFFLKGPDTWGDPDRWFDIPELPSLGPWITTDPMGTGSTVMLERNPYYWKVDAAGNQLPYIDTIRGTSYQDFEARTLAMLNGDLDAIKDQGDENRGLYVDARRAGKPVNINTVLDDGGNGLNFYFNWTVRDDVKAEVFQNKDFRIGVSHAINRPELIELFNSGQGWPAQTSPLPDSPLYNEQLSTQYTEYDVELANELLDKVLPEKDSKGFRLGPDGKRFSFVLIAVNDWSWAPDNPQRGEILVSYMQEVGLDAKLNAMPSEQFDDLRIANDFDAAISTGEGGAGLTGLLDARNYVPMEQFGFFGNAWSLWRLQDPEATGEEEPPQWVKDARLKYDQALSQPTQAEQIEAMSVVLEEAADRFYGIGAYQGGTGYYPWHSRVGNIYDEWYGGWIAGVQKILYPEQWYIQQ